MAKKPTSEDVFNTRMKRLLTVFEIHKKGYEKTGKETHKIEMDKTIHEIEALRKQGYERD